VDLGCGQVDSAFLQQGDEFGGSEDAAVGHHFPKSPVVADLPFHARLSWPRSASATVASRWRRRVRLRKSEDTQRWQGSTVRALGRHRRRSSDGGLRQLVGAGLMDLVRLWDQQLADLATQRHADDVEVGQLHAGRIARPQTGHLPSGDHQAVLGQRVLQLAGLPDSPVRGGQPQVPLHDSSPSKRCAARCWPATQASSIRAR
jgi:hypothetical protein